MVSDPLPEPRTPNLEPIFVYTAAMRHNVRTMARGGRPYILQFLLVGAIVAAPIFVSEAVQPGAVPVQAKADTPQFRLPFAEPPGPDTWFVSQGYGTTVWAQRNWPDLYAAG